MYPVMEFYFKQSRIYQAVKFSRLLVLGPLKLWRILFLIAGVAALGFYVLNRLFTGLDFVLVNNFWRGFNASGAFLGSAYIFLPLGFGVLFLEIFFNYYLKYPKIRDENNLAEFLDFDAAILLDKAGSADELLLAISDYAPAGNVLIRIGLNPKRLKESFKKSADAASVGGYDWTAFLTDAFGVKEAHGGNFITLMDLIASLFNYNDAFKQLAIGAGLDKKDLVLLATWYESNAEFYKKKKMFWRLDNLLRRPPVGVGWTYGYSKYLSHYATDLTRRFQTTETEIKLIGREHTIDQIEQILSQSGQNNVLLVGEPGVGKHAVILGFAQLIAQGKALPALNYKRVFELNVPLIASSSKDAAEVQNNLIILLNEAVKAGNVILVIEDFHNFIGALSGMGRTDISQILLPYLESTDIQIIATTDLVSYHKHIEPRAEITKVLEKIEIEEPSTEETTKIIEEIIPKVEASSKVFFTYGAIKNIVEGSDRYIKTAPLPEKAIDLVAEVVSRASSIKKPIISPQDVNEVITLKTRIPLGNIGEIEKTKLINLEAEMHQEIVGQDEAVRAIARTMQRLRAGLAKRGKPAGVFLFAGPTGVGKTLTAKILAKIYFGSPDKMTRFDMSEYQDMESLDRFLGSLRINEPGQLASRIRDNPFSVILFDELEKTHKNILNIFLSIFDEGSMTDVFGRKVSFEQNIIIATSNAAADLIRDMVKGGLDPAMQKEKVIDALVRERYFTPELLNRFDEVVIFHPLNQEELHKIADLLVSGLVERMREQGYFFKPAPDVIDYISRVGFDPQFGARPMQRAVQDKLETVIARRILEGTVKKGTEFGLNLEEIK